MNFGEYLPDLAPYGLDGLTVASGVYPAANGYRPVGSFTASPDGTLAAQCLGAYAARAGDGTVYVFAGTTSNLYSYTGSAWSSKGSGYTGSSLIGWRFERFGNLVIATNGVDAMQKFDLATPTTFSALGGTPPTARYLAVVRDFLFAGFAGGSSIKVRWSAINNCEAWTIGTAQADEQDMPTGGEITGITGGEYGLVFQEKRIVRMTYVGGDLIFQFDEISSNIGCIAPWSIAQAGNLVFFLSEQGFMVCDGSSARPIGSEKIDRTWGASAVRGYYPNMSAVTDPKNNLVLWALPDTSGNPSTIYIYNWTLGRWSTASQSCERLFSGMSQNITLEQLDALYPSIDAMPASLDSPLWTGGNPAVFLFNSSHAFGSLAGYPNAVSIRTGIQGGGKRIRGRRLRPQTDAPAMTVKVLTRDDLNDTATTNSFTTMERGGWYSTRYNAAYTQYQIDIAAAAAGSDTWTYITGVEEDLTQGGRW